MRGEFFNNIRLSDNQFQQSDAECIIKVEMGLLLLEHLGFSNPYLIWAVSDGHHQLLERPNARTWSLDDIRRITNFRLWLKEPSRYYLTSLIDQYKKMKLGLCLFEIGQASMECRDAVFSRKKTLPDGLESREARLQDLLNRPPKLQHREVEYARVGDYSINVRMEGSKRSGDYPVNISEKFAQNAPDLGNSVFNLHRLRDPNQEPKKLVFSWVEILETAKWMDDTDRSQGRPERWYNSLASKEFLKINQETSQLQGFSLGDTFTLGDIDHLVGMVNSGKSTLLIVMIVNFCRKYKGEFHGSIVLSEVAEILDKVRIFERYGIKAVPFIGEHNRPKHLAQLHQSIARECIKGQDDDVEIPFAYVPLQSHPGFKYLFNSCALGGYVLDKDFPIRMTSLPCKSLKKGPAGGEVGNSRTLHTEEQDQKKCWCPYLLSCPVNSAQVDAVDADVWLTTPHGLIFISILPPLVRVNYLGEDGNLREVRNPEIKLFEAVCRRSDLVVYDEADRAQVTFDYIFAPSDKMIGDGEGFLDRLNYFDASFNSVTDRSRQWNPRDRRYSDSRESPTILWLNSTQMAIHVANRLMSRLYDDPESRRIVGEDIFSGLSVSTKVASKYLSNAQEMLEEESTNDIGENGESLEGSRPNSRHPHTPAFDYFVEICNKFSENPLSLGRKNRLTHGSVPPLDSFLLLYGSGEEISEYVEDLVQHDLFPDEYNAMDQPSQTRFIQAFILAIWVNVLGYATNQVLATWDEVRGVVSAPTPDVASWFEHLSDYKSIIPRPPIGVMIGFRYTRDEKSGSARLEHLRFGGIGRWLLYNAKIALAHERIIGPSTFLMSATSFAPGSSKYHVQFPVTCVLKVAGPDIAEIQKTEQFVHLFKKSVKGAKKIISVSGSGDTEQRDENFTELVKALVRQRSVPHGKTDFGKNSILELSFRHPNRRHALLVCNSYKQVELARQGMIEERGGEFTERIWGIRRAEDPDVPAYENTLERASVELYGFLDEKANGLIAPMMAIERGHNILNRDNIAAFSSVFFLIRPMPVPNDVMPTISKLNYLTSQKWIPSPVCNGLGLEASQQVSEELNIRPISGDQDPTSWNNYDRAANYRNELYHLWRRLIRGWTRFRDLPKFERDDLAWTDLILFVQTAGRCVRGNQAVNIYYCDGAFVPNSCKSSPLPDTIQTSLLLGIEEMLDNAFAPPQPKTSPINPVQQELIRILYGWFYESFRKALNPFQTTQNTESV